VVIVGAGLVGLACAYSLASSGLETLVIDAEQAGSGASWGNAGHVVFAPEVVAPVPAPGVVRMALRWLVQRDSPLRLAPRLEPAYLRWLIQFISSCSPEAAAAGLQATLALNSQTAELFDALEREGLEFEMERLGMLLVYRKRQSFESARKKALETGGSGADVKILSRDEAVEAEPLLRADACAGAIRREAERQIRPDKLINALVERLGRMGVPILTQTSCLGVVRSGQKVAALQTPEGPIRGNAYVLAPGAGLSALASQVGVRIPVEGGRGYSFDVPRDGLPLRTPVYVYDGRLALTPFREFTRVVGMMELGMRAATVRAGAIETMNHVGAATFRHWPRREAGDAWAGLRPMTPDGLPVIGAVEGIDNLYVAGGHGMLGVTLCLRTGTAIAACIRGEPTDPILEPFRPCRFARKVPRST
jgi:D-amino-acid dehydrogenase